MALPKLNVPVYEAVLPSTEKVIKYRPFLVKEEKLLFTAQESGEEAVLPAVKQIIKNCVQGELDIDNMPLFDIEYLFLRLRAKSVGEEVTLGLKPWGCPNNKGELCEKTTQVNINLEDVKVIKDKKHSSKVMIDDTIGIKLSYPDMNKLGSMGADVTTTSGGMDIIVALGFREDATGGMMLPSDCNINEFRARSIEIKAALSEITKFAAKEKVHLQNKKSKEKKAH